MAINLSVQYNGGFLPDIILLLTQCYHHWGNPIKCHEEVLSLQPMMTPKFFFKHLNVFTFFPLTGGCSEGVVAFRFFFKYIHTL